jgi:uncharacterized protein (TIGR03437 family)
MDAAQKLLKNSAILTATAVLLATVGSAATPPTLIVNTSVSLAGTGGQIVNVTSSDSTVPITYTIGSPGYANDNGGSTVNWLSASGGTTTPASLTFSLVTTAGLAQGSHQATVVLTPSAPLGVTPVTITITYSSGSGGGGSSGTLSATPSPIYISAAANTITSPATVVISTNSASTVTIASVSTALVTGTGVNWLSASIVNATVSQTSTGSITVTASSVGLASGSTYQGTVTVSPTTGTALSITVYFTVGSGSGTGNWSVSPSPISWSYATGGSFPAQTVSVTAPSGATYYNVVCTSSNGWLLGAYLGGGDGTSLPGISPTTGFILKAGSNANALTQGQYTGTATLTDSNNNQYSLNVTITVNGGNSAGLTISPNPLTFNSAVNGAQQNQVVTLTSNAGGAVTVTGSGTIPSWLTATGPSPSTVSAGQSSTFTVTASPNGWAAGSYSATIAVTVGSQSGTLTVNLVVGGSTTGTGTTAVAPTSLNFSYALGTNMAFIAQEKLVITGPAGAWSSTIATSGGGNWLKLTPANGTSLPDPAVSGATPIVSIDPTGLTAGTYTGTITITTTGGTQPVSVSLNVLSGTIIIPTPGALVFTAQTGQANPIGQSVYFSGSDTTLNPLSISAVANNSWISLNTGATYVSVSVDQTGLSTGVYSGSVSVSQGGAANSPTTVPVILVVNGGGSSGGTGTLTFSPTSISFSSVNGSTPGNTTLGVSATSSTSFVGSITYSSGSGWLTVSPLSSVTPASLTVSANPSGLAAGTYNATISFNVNGVIQTVGVSLSVSTSTGGNTGNVTVSPTSLTFSSQSGSSPGAQSVSVSSASGTAGVGFTVTPTTTSGGSWLSTSANANPTTPYSFNVSVNSNSLAAGTYSGNIQLVPTGGTTVNIPVSLTLTAPAAVSATPTTLTFNYRAGDSAPAAQTLTVSGGGASLAYSATAASTGNWLVVSPATGTTPGTVNVSISTTGLSTGTYTGTVLVAGTGTASGSTTVNVTVNVTAPLPTITKVTNAASYATGAISPGEIITLFASDTTHPIGPATAAGLTLDSSGNVSTTIGGVQVLIQGYACPMIYASASQVSAVVPYEDKIFGSASVLVKFLGQSSNGVPVTVATTAPGIFTANSSGTGPGAILNSNNSVNTPSNPAARGDIVVVYMTGEGETSPFGVTGKVTTVAAPPQPLTPGPLLRPSVTIGGQPANYSFAGEAPGLVSGVLQMNVTVPTNIAAGDQPIVVSIGGNASQQGVTVSVK